MRSLAVKARNDRISRIVLPVITGCLLLALWYWIKGHWNLHDFILPAPHDVLIAFASERETLFRATGVTFMGAMIGFIAAISIGFAISLAMASIRILRYSLYPFVIFMQMIPILAMAAIVVIFFDVGLQSVALIAFLIGFFPVVASTLQGLMSVPEGQREMFRIYKASPWQELFLLRVPYSLPYFFTGAKIAATLAVIGSVTGEIFAGSTNRAGGLGFMIMIYKSELKISAIYAATLLCCLLGFCFVAVVLYFRQLALRKWHESSFPEQN
ncbi:ABC transporter permease [Puniceicoccales bacterium CK1056]|uniref:ABC transporter permease n=1 Tax=Oceanipulchritudo coccoides TaxID=2706888 RepID=A0A6B2M3T3_9BACT|nr:ABC transporter permease [Oceanipulchritudo coccoides]NDV62747.1 ABC transporter permease [Oceanipulchritudo coccoides]